MAQKYIPLHRWNRGIIPPPKKYTYMWIFHSEDPCLMLILLLRFFKTFLIFGLCNFWANFIWLQFFQNQKSHKARTFWPLHILVFYRFRKEPLWNVEIFLHWQINIQLLNKYLNTISTCNPPLPFIAPNTTHDQHFLRATMCHSSFSNFN